MDTFLTQCEKNRIQVNYETIIDHMKCDDLILKLISHNIITINDKNSLKYKTDSEKCQYVVDEVFFKSTYQQIHEIRTILFNSEHSGHKSIAGLLPFRNVQRQPSRSDSDPNLYCNKKPEVVSHSPETNEDYSHHLTDTLYGAAGPENSSSEPDGLFKKFSNSFRRKKTSKSTPNIIDSKPKLGQYRVKDGNPSTGMALVLIIINFTEDLEGYLQDKQALIHLHKNILHHDLLFVDSVPESNQFTNLTRKELLTVLQNIQNFLANPMSGNKIDRLFIYILSHGDKDGIMTCKEGSASDVEGYIDPETKKEILVRTQMQEIVDMFTHDKLPNLKGFPKIFVNQSCRGSEILRPANRGMDKDEVDKTSEEVWQPPIAKVAIGADVMVCQSTSDNNLAWVSRRGSLYLQNYVNAIKDYHATEHFHDILVEVNDVMSQKMKKGVDPKSAAIVEVTQMPVITSKLTKKFYLS